MSLINENQAELAALCWSKARRYPVQAGPCAEMYDLLLPRRLSGKIDLLGNEVASS